LVRSIAITTVGGSVLAVYRRRIGATDDGDLIALWRDGPEGRSRTLTAIRAGDNAKDRIIERKNAGFDTQILQDRHDTPTVLHFSHEFNHLIRSRLTNGKWELDTLGRQGDGFGL